MKKLTVIKQFLFVSLLIAGMNIYSSCDGCNRPDGNSEGTNDGMDTNGNTRGTEQPADNEDSGSTEGTGSGTANDGRTSSTSINSSTGGTNSTSTVSTGTAKSGLSDEEITNQVENSNASSAYDKEGKPVISSGSAGTGSGTGTGTTGNNSRVRTKEDQKS